MVTSGVVWCYKDDHWIPLQLSSIRLHGVLTQAHWVAVSEFLQRMANKQLVLQDNCFKELTEQQKELLLEQQKKLECSRAIENKVEDMDKNLSQLVLNTLNNNVLNNNDSVIKLADNNKSGERCITTPNGRVIQISKSEIGDDKNLSATTDKRLNAENSQVLMFKFEKSSSEDERQQNTDNNKNLFINNLFTETDTNSLETNHDRSSTIEEASRNSNRKTSSQSDEIALRLLRKYCKYSRDALDDDILSAIEATEQNSDEEKLLASPPTVVRTRKLGYCPRNEKLYENCSDMKFSLEETIENDRNEHVLRWLKQQNRHGYTNKRRCSLPTFSSNRKSSVSSLGEPSPTDTRKSSLTIKSDGKSSFSSGFESQKSSVISATESRDANSLTSSPSASERRSSVSNLKCRKSSVTSNSSTESEENGTIAAQWHKILKRHLESKKLEKRLKKQREAWARNTRKLSSGSESYSDISTKPLSLRGVCSSTYLKLT
ncbi:hypothetical protein AMK59_391 [Oryctes borbonicus]|uniref:Uncharacterized protein n=1 Tax=Oryctes borbonicus TaxID=1629725 RepID=A0A0T6BA02_9SCAR|nr:hypothetical protein AMK59_391 [Oryctes borbonicus]